MHAPAIDKLPCPRAAIPKMVCVDRLNVLEPSSYQSMAPSVSSQGCAGGLQLACHALHLQSGISFAHASLL